MANHLVECTYLIVLWLVFQLLKKWSCFFCSANGFSVLMEMHGVLPCMLLNNRWFLYSFSIYLHVYRTLKGSVVASAYPEYELLLYLLLISRILQCCGSQLLDPGSLWTLISAHLHLGHSEMKFNWRLPDPAVVSVTCKILPVRGVIAFGCHL